MKTALSDAQAALAAATQSADRETKTVYLATARTLATRARLELETFEMHLKAVEAELVRTQGRK